MKNHDFAILMAALIVALFLALGLVKMGLMPDFLTEFLFPRLAEAKEVASDPKPETWESVLEGATVVQMAVCLVQGGQVPCAILQKDEDTLVVLFDHRGEVVAVIRERRGVQSVLWQR